MKDLRKMAKNNKGFSLVELLIALLIMAVIAAAAITLFGGVLQSSKGGADRETAENIKKAILTYANAANDPHLTALGTSGGAINAQNLVYKLAQTITISGTNTTYVNPSNSVIPAASRPVNNAFVDDNVILDGVYGPFLDATKSLVPQQNTLNSWIITVDAGAQTITVASTTGAIATTNCTVTN